MQPFSNAEKLLYMKKHNITIYVAFYVLSRILNKENNQTEPWTHADLREYNNEYK